ncbi:MAG: class II aldolase/adducin family protein [Armatimonadetes bacterium]|nr:class II aldolase/adducin family protein [Armatimonadota bacterium]
MTEAALREAICEIGRRLWQMGMAPANAGNISALLNGGRVLCTPTGVSKGSMRPAELVVVDLAGTVLDGGAVSSEIGLHLTCYRQRADVGAVVHVHPPAATGFACSPRPLPVEILTEAVCLLGRVPTVPAATPGTTDVSEALQPYLPQAVAFLLANHGALTLGKDVWEAYFRMEVLEHSAQVALAALQAGGLVPIPTGMMGRLQGP